MYWGYIPGNGTCVLFVSSVSQWVVFTFHNRFVLNYMLLLIQFVVQYSNYNHRTCTV